jgi:7,8-dihydropterin-6-yl-methyl-4-(beta-D-ribofuranosyl)aminobenzene 5'-phosphate synthase
LPRLRTFGKIAAKGNQIENGKDRAMEDLAQKLETVDRVEILTLVDNYVDVLLTGGPGFTRPALAKGGEIPRHTLIAEHGLSLLITVYRDGVGHTVLLDTGYNSATMLHNMDYLDVDPAGIEAVVLSHGHMDHSGGLYPLLKKLGRTVTVVAHPDVFRQRFLVRPQLGKVSFPLTADIVNLRELNAEFVEANAPVFLAENTILVSGEVPRSTPFEKGMPGAFMEEHGEMVPDAIRDDQTVLINLAGRGLVVISGCAHSGIINSVRYARQLTGESRVAAVIGGFHLSGSDMEPLIDSTLSELKQLSPELIMPMHCTGWNAIQRLQGAFPKSFVLSSVGTKLVLPRGGVKIRLLDSY